MTVFYEYDGPNDPVPVDAVDGMAELVEGDHDVLSSDWDLAFENPPHEFLAGLDLHASGAG